MPLVPVTKVDTAISLWNAADILAARYRLQLAKRYQHQFERLDLEFTNLNQIRTTLSNRQDQEAICLLIEYVQVMTPYLRQRGRDSELLHWCEDGLLACKQLSQNPAWIFLCRGGAQNRLGQWENARESFIAATEAGKDYDTQLYAEAILELGRLLLNQGYYEKALTLLAEGEGLLNDTAHYELLAIARSEVAAYHLNRDEFDKALTLYEEADQIHRRAGARQSSDYTLMMLGVVHRKKGDYGLAIDYLQKLLVRGERQGNQGAVAPAAHHLAWTYFKLGDLVKARHYCGQAIALYKELEDPRGVSDGYEQLGLILLAEGHHDEAVMHLRRSLEMRKQLGNQHGAASSRRHLAQVYWQMGHWLVAVRELAVSLKVYWKLGVLSRNHLFNIWREFFEWWT